MDAPRFAAEMEAAYRQMWVNWCAAASPLGDKWRYKNTALMTQLTIQQAFDLALQHHQAGRCREAEQLYRQILAQQPDHVDAMHMLGVIAHQLGRNDWRWI